MSGTKNLMEKTMKTLIADGNLPTDTILQMAHALWKSCDKKKGEEINKFMIVLMQFCINKRVEAGECFKEMVKLWSGVAPCDLREADLPPNMFRDFLPFMHDKEYTFKFNGGVGKYPNCIPLVLCVDDIDDNPFAYENLVYALEDKYPWKPASNEFQTYGIIHRWEPRLLTRVGLVLDRRPEILGDHVNLLMLAANMRIFELVKLLIEHENSTASLDSVDDNGNTALMWMLSDNYCGDLDVHESTGQPLTFEMVKYLAVEDDYDEVILMKNSHGKNALHYIRENNLIYPELKAEIIRYLEPLYTVVKMLPDGNRLEYNVEKNSATFTELGTDGLVEITGEVRLVGESIVRIVRVVSTEIAIGTLEVFDPETGEMKPVAQPAQLIEVLKTVVV